MSNSTPTNPLERFLRTMEKIPPRPGLVFHGLPSAGSSSSGGTLLGIVATSRNPRMATENFTTADIACIVTLTGRDIGPLSAHPAEEETVLLPGIVLLPIMSVRHETLGMNVLVFEELNPDADATDVDREAASTRLRNDIEALLEKAWNSAPVEITSPGKFSAPLPL